MSLRVVLDAAAFDYLATTRGTSLRAVLRKSAERGGEACCAAVTLAEVCRGTARTAQVEAALAFDRGGQRIRVVPTEERLAKAVGAILHSSDAGSVALADAHVVALCSGADQALVLTEDPDDIALLAMAVPGTRIVLRRPSAPLG